MLEIILKNSLDLKEQNLEFFLNIWVYMFIEQFLVVFNY